MKDFLPGSAVEKVLAPFVYVLLECGLGLKRNQFF
jgi:hypothetical protein